MTAPEQQDSPNLAVAATVIVSTQRSEEESKAFYLRVNEWNRIKRAAQRIQRDFQWWTIGYSAALGLALSCFANWLVAKQAKTPDLGAIYANGYLALVALVAALLCFVADRREAVRTTSDAAELLHEMTLVERSNEAVFGPSE